MVRLILRLFGIRDFEVCASCETLKSQLAIANAERAELTSLILDIAKPKPVVPYEPTKSIPSITGVFARRQAELEARDRAAAKAMRSDFNVAKVNPEAVAEAVSEIEAEVKRQENAS